VVGGNETVLMATARLGAALPECPPVLFSFQSVLALLLARPVFAASIARHLSPAAENSQPQHHVSSGGNFERNWCSFIGRWTMFGNLRQRL